MNLATRILFLDDDPQVRALALMLVKQELPDSHCEEIVDGDGLARALEQERVGLVITDYQLGWTNGLDVLRRVKARWPDCPVIMFTGTGNEEIAVEAMKSGLDDYVLKSPPHCARLPAAVRLTLEQAERSRTLKATEARYRTLINDVLDTSDVGVFILDARFQVVWANKALERHFGLRRDDLLGQDARRLVHERIKHMFAAPEDFAAKILQTYERNDCVVSFDCRVPAGDGREERWFEHRSLPIRTGLYAGGRIEHYSDITERKRADAALRESNNRLTALIQASPMAITVLDADGTVQVWNPAAERLFGWSAGEVLGHPFPTVPKGKQAEHHELVARVLADQAFTGLEVVRHRKDGAPLTVSLSTAPLRNAEGRIIGAVGIMVDVTERKQMERHAGRIERLAALGQLLGGIAHEIKNPLFVLTGRLQLLKEKLKARDYGTLPSDLEKLEEAAKRIAHVTERFLALARPAQFRQTRCDIRAILDETLEFLSNELMKSQIRLVIDASSALPPIRSDPHQLQEAFLNLLLNAMQAMVAAHGRGTLTVSAQLSPAGDRPEPSAEQSSVSGDGLEEPWIEVRIQDDGPGILPEHRPRLFEPFFSTKPANEGTGLGLWTVRTIIMSLKGRVTFETDVGRGTTFIVRLPVSEELNS